MTISSADANHPVPSVPAALPATLPATLPRVQEGAVPHDGESLIGLVARTAAMNRHARTGWLLATATDKAHSIGNLALREDVDFDALAYAARLDPADLQTRRYRQVAISSKLPGVDFHGATIPLYDLILGRRRQAASWSDGAWHHRAIGHHGLITHCPRSGERLFDRCFRCDAVLRWADPDPRHCVACNVDLSSGDDETLEATAVEAIRPMIALVDPDPAARSVASRLPASIQRLGRGAAFELGWRVGCIRTGHGLGDRDRAKAMPVEARLEILRAGSDALVDWPRSLRAAISDRVRDAGGAAAKALAGELRAVARADNAWPEVRDAVIDAMPSLSKSLAAAVKETLPGGVNAAEAQVAMGVGQKLFQRIREGDHLKPVIDGGQVNRFQIFSGDAVAPVREALEDRIALGSARRLLGITRHGVEQLCCLGLCELLRTEVVTTVFSEPQIRRSGLDGLLSKLQGRSLPDEPDDAVSLRDAMSRIGGREKPWGPAFSAMLDGSLPFHLAGTRSARLTRGLMVPGSALDRLEELRFDREDHVDFQFEDGFIREDVEELLNLNPTTFQRAIRGGELSAADGAGYDAASMRALAGSHISAREIAARWGRSGRKLPKRAVLSRAARQGHLGWSREAVELAMDGPSSTLH